MSAKRCLAICKRISPFLLLLVLLSCVIHSAEAQNQYIPKIIPPSPNTATLFKFSDVPVSTYTGTASVNVPIYTIHTKALSVPVSLDYHTGGIRLKEEAGWVGLGWALTAGGAVTRTIMDDDDFGTNKNYFTSVVPQLEGDISSIQNPGTTFTPVFGPYFWQFICNYQMNTTGGVADYTNALNSAVPPYDMEPDIFSYNFPGKSGSFIITRD